LEQIAEEYIEWAREQPGFRDYYAEAEAKMQQLGTLRRVGEGESGRRGDGERGR